MLKTSFSLAFAFALSGPIALLPSSARAQEFVKVSEEFIYEIAPFPSCHASTIEEAADGTLVTAWFGGLYEKSDDVGIWVSRLEKKQWTAPVEVANGVQFQWATPQQTDAGDKVKMVDVKRFPTWNPVLFQPTNGPLLLFYKAGPNPDAWWGMLSQSNDHGKTWSPGVRLPEGILGPIKNKPIELADGTILCPTSNETPGDKDEWTVHFEWTKDLGKTWTRTPPLNDPTRFGAIQPSVLQLGGNKLLALGRSRQGKIFQIESADLGKTWSEMSLIDLPNPNSGTDAVTLKNGTHLLVYNHVTKETQEWGGRRSPLNVAVSSDGKTWRSVMELENEPKKEFSYPAVIQTRDGKIHITYTWLREKIKHVVLEMKP
ncbi:sialidase family protein [Pirellulaceae bacterium SH501]